MKTELDYGRSTGLVLITDVGSTTTKALLLARGKTGLSILGGVDVPTTVERPREDVCAGVAAAVNALERITGERLSKNDGMPAVPYLSTSSAGGGLQMIVFGLTSVETGRIAENTASNAGGVILQRFSIDDGLQAVEKMMAIQRLHPDMIMLAGGTDGGAIAGVVRLAELLSLAKPLPKFKQNMKIPLIFCGNVNARDFVADVLNETFDVHIVENVRPSMNELNIEPAREQVHQLFMENVMERAPGYSRLKEYVISNILPTPAGVENILTLYSEERSDNVLMIDMGGATTDIFSRILGGYNRTVAANTGMSYSLANIPAKSGMDSIMKHLPEGFDAGQVRNYIYNKTVFPTYRPSGEGELLVEQAAAICGVASAWKEHTDSCFQLQRVGFLDRLKRKNRCMFEETFRTPENGTFSLSSITRIIGAGGVISHASEQRAFLILSEGLRPMGVTAILVDRDFRSPHLGVLSEIDPEGALELFRNECLEELGWIIAPFGKMDEGDQVLTVHDRSTGMSRSLKFEEVLYLEKGGDIDLELGDGVSIGEAEDHLSTDKPVLIDCRGFEEDVPSLASFTETPFFSPAEHFTCSVSPEAGTVSRGDWKMEYRLPYRGTILVNHEDMVEPGTVLGENRYDPPRLYMIDLNRIPGYDRHLTPREILNGLLVKAGDRVKLNSPLYKVSRPGVTGFDFTFHSPVRGRVTKIEENGIIIVREIQDYDEKPHVIKVAQPLGIKPKHIGGHLKRKPGDFVEAGQIIASDLSRGRAASVKSPTSGILKEIDKKAGTVTIQFDITPVLMKAHVRGMVQEVIPDQGVIVSGSGTRLFGVIGFGGETSGRLVEMNGAEEGEIHKGDVLFKTGSLTFGELQMAASKGASAIIAPSVESRDWLQFSGRELGVAVTGDEAIPLTLLLTSGFGDIEMKSDTAELLRDSSGSMVCVSGRTQIRAGVTRPFAIIME